MTKKALDINNLYETWTLPPTFSTLFQSHVLLDLLAVPASSSWRAETKSMLSGPPAHHNTDVHEGVHPANESTGKSTASILENTQQKPLTNQSQILKKSGRHSFKIIFISTLPTYLKRDN